MTSTIDVIDAFSLRPTLRAVATQTLHASLDRQFPDLKIDPQLYVITRTLPDGTQKAETLLRNLQQAFLSGKTPRWRSDANTLVLNFAKAGEAAMPVDFDQLNILVDTVSLELNAQYQRALVDFWGAPLPSGQSPWARVADTLKQNFLKAVEDTADLSEGERGFLRAIAAFSDRTQRDFMLRIDDQRTHDVIRVGVADHSLADQAQGFSLPAMIASGTWKGQEVFFSWQSPSPLISRYVASSLPFGESPGDAVRLGLREPDDVFDALAQSILDSQLQQIQRLERTAAQDVADLERRYHAVTDLTPYLLAPAPGIHGVEKLPDWLRTASVTDRMDFSRRMVTLASAQMRAAGHSFNENLPPLLEYANRQLQEELLADHPDAADVAVADLDVLIHKVVAVAIPGGGQVVAAGSVEPVRMSVAEFALENLSGEPGGALKVVFRNGAPAPAWFSADYLRLLVCQVDIGRSYPALVQRLLVDDRAEAARRQVLYIDQLRTWLPLKALELKIRGEHHFCDEAYRLVAALVQPMEQRAPALRATTLRPLAFRASIGARADVVDNMFVIGDRNTAQGPVVLYRPFSSRTLSEFSSWAALRAAIVQPGDLQHEVLAWMSDHARQRYANGGFDQPHILRFGQGSDFAPLQTPSPAQLVVDEIVGDPLPALFNAHASALVELADRQSTSNAESRWTLLKRGGWLALDVVMPFISGPAGTALWLVQLMTEADAALAADDAASAEERSALFGNLLLTVAMLLLHSGWRDDEAQTGGAEHAKPRPADAFPAPATAPAGATLPPGVTTRLDFSWSRPDQTLTPHQKTLLESFRVVPRPELPLPSRGPVTEGLYELHGHWYAQIGDAVFKVRVADGEVQVIDPVDAERTGPPLVRDGERWRLDLALRLRGGGPKRNARQLALENAARLKLVNAEKSALLKRQNDLYIQIVANDNRLDGLPIEQHGAIISLLEADIRAVIEIVDRKSALDGQLRPADRTGDKACAKDLQGISRRVCLLEGVLLSDMLIQAREDLARMNAVASSVTAENVGLYLGLFEKSLRLQEMGVHWSIVREALWQRLRDVPKVGEQYWRAEALEFYKSRMFGPIEWRSSRMWSSLELCFSAESILDGRQAVALKRLLNDDALHAALTSQAELEKPRDCTIADQISVLESSLREYNRASIVALAAFESEPEVVDKTHFERFYDDLSAISDRAEHRLSDLIRESEEPAQTPSEYVPRVSQARKRVIKTRGQRTLIGRLRDGEEPALGEVVEVKAASGDRVIGAYHLHAEGEWVELEEQRPKLISRDSIVPVAELMRRGRALLERVEPDIASAVRQSRRANEPEDMEDILGQKADKIHELIEKLQIHGDDPHAGEGHAQALDALLTELRVSESRFREQGRQLRIEMIKRQPPTANRISYLDRQREVNIARFEGRKNMSGARRNDFVQEYAIRDTEGQLLWWAHFHYTSENAPADAFSAAHLKLPEQRLMGYRALLKAAKDNKEVVSIYRSAIGKDLAQRLFLHLAE